MTRNCRDRSFEVIKVMESGTNEKIMCDFLLTNNSNCGPISYRFGDTATQMAKIAEFAYTLSDLAHPLKVLNDTGDNINITLHVWFEYPNGGQVSFRGQWLDFAVYGRTKKLMILK